MPEASHPEALGDVAVVTVAYNSSDILDAFLGSLRASDTTNVTVIVADNDSQDRPQTAEISRRYGAHLLPLDINAGYGGAINVAARSLDPAIRWILVVNPDVTFTPGSITALVAAARRDSSVGSAGPRIVGSDGAPYPSARQIPSLRTGVGHALFVNIWPQNPWTRAYLADRSDSSVPHAVGWLSGACVLIRREAFDQLGGFDDDYFMYFEDVDLGYRLGRAGWKNLFYPDAVVEHSGAHSTTKESGKMLRVHHQSAYRFLARKYSAWYLAPLRAVLRAGLWARGRLLARVAR